MDNTLSAVIIAKDEQERIQIAIDSVSFADELLVIDNGSLDKTAALAKKSGANVISSPGSSFGELRNIGKQQAMGKWILYLDADEVMPVPLAKEIEAVVAGTPTHSCYFIRRNNYYLGNQWPVSDRMQRLFLKTDLIAWRGDLHESPEVKGSTGELTHSLDHDTHRTLEEMLQKTNTWSNTEAHLRLLAHHPPIVAWRLIRVAFTGFWRTYINEGGWRVGTVGMIESIYQGFSLFITYAKLWELQQKKK